VRRFTHNNIQYNIKQLYNTANTVHLHNITGDMLFGISRWVPARQVGVSGKIGKKTIDRKANDVERTRRRRAKGRDIGVVQ